MVIIGNYGRGGLCYHIALTVLFVAILHELGVLGDINEPL